MPCHGTAPTAQLTTSAVVCVPKLLVLTLWGPCKLQEADEYLYYKDLHSFWNVNVTEHIYIIFLLKIWRVLLSGWIENPFCNPAKMLTSVMLYGSDCCDSSLMLFSPHSAKITITTIKDPFPYRKVAVLPTQLRLLISEPPPQHRISADHIAPCASMALTYFYTISILLGVYLGTLFVFWLLLHSEQIFSLALGHP